MNFDAIVIDTSIYQRYGFRFDQGLLKTLEQFAGKPAGLLIPEIIAREMIDHISHKACDASIQLERALKNFDAEIGFPDIKEALKLYSADGEEVAKQKFSKFVKATGAKLIRTEGLLNVQELIDCSFGKAPPFSSKKKNEFPDAITLLVLDEYARRNQIRILAVSADNDWKDYICTSKYLGCTDDLAEAISEFQPQESLFKICEQLASIFSESDDYYVEKLRVELSKACFSQDIHYEAYSEFTWEPQFVALEFISLEFFGADGTAKFYPVSMKKDQLTVETKVIVSAKAIGEFSLFVYDPSGRGSEPNIPVGGVRKEINVKFAASVMFTTDLLEMEIFGPLFSDLEISIDPIHIDFGALDASHIP